MSGDVDQLYDLVRTSTYARCQCGEITCTSLQDGLVFGIQCDKGVQDDGSLVSSWTDQVRGRFFSQPDNDLKLQVHATPWPNGQPRIYSAGGDYLRIQGNNIIHLPAKPWSIAVYANFYSTAEMAIYQNVVGDNVEFERSSQADNYVLRFDAVGLDQFTINAAVPVGIYACVVGLNIGGNGKAYVDGVTKTRPPGTPDDDYPIQFIGRAGAVVGPYLACLLVYDRLLVQAEADTFKSDCRSYFGYS